MSEPRSPTRQVQSIIPAALLGLVLGLAVVCASTSRASARPAPAPNLHRCGLDSRTAATPRPVSAKAAEVPGLGASGLAPVRRAPTAAHALAPGQGALAGKSVYVSPGHGWLWSESLGRYNTQRGNTNGIVEDMISTEVAAQYLVEYLRNMGAYVVTVRENDMNPNIAFADDGIDGFESEGAVALREGPAGYQVQDAPYEDGVHPFSSGGSKVFDAAASSTGHVLWTFDVPESGEYHVYVGYVQAADRASDARYTVRHAGGESAFLVDQRRHGGTWMFLGKFYFEKGASSQRGAVLLDNASDDDGATLSADVVRIGGGLSQAVRGGETSGRPAYEDGALFYTQSAGAPPEVYGSGDVWSRSRFAAWDHEEGEDAVYIAWHTNASTGSAQGTSSFAYGPSSFGPIAEFTGVAGSVELLGAVHDELVEDLQQGWDSAWTEFGAGLYSAYFGEVNPNNNPEMPSGLFEIGFHDNPEDARALSDPRFRRVAGRAMAQGVAKYFAQRDGTELVLPPDEPRALAAEQSGDQVRFHWLPPANDAGGGDAAQSYRIYLSNDGLAFDDGRDVEGTSFQIDASSARYARVTALNAGGESFPSSVVGARASISGRPQVLIVNDFARLDRGQLLAEDLSAYSLGTVARMDLARMNDFTHVQRYAQAVDAAGVSFASATATMVRQGHVELEGYIAVVWFAGETSKPLTESDVALLDAYLADEGRLVISGSKVAASLAGGTGAQQSFLADSLSAGFESDDAETYELRAPAGAFSEVGDLRFDDSGTHSYDADAVDVVSATAGSDLVLTYVGGSGAATLKQGESGGAALLFAFPFETLDTAESRHRLMAATLATLSVDADAPPETMEPGGDAGIGEAEVRGGCGCQTSHSGVGASYGVLLLMGVLCLRRRRQDRRPARRLARRPARR